MFSKFVGFPRTAMQYSVPKSYCTIPGAPSGKGGGAGGPVKESGVLGRYAHAQEEGYFYNKQRETLRKLKDKLKGEEKKNPDHKQD